MASFSGAQARHRIALALVAASLGVAVGAERVAAQAAYDHSAWIDNGLRGIGGAAKLTSVPAERKGVLAAHLAARGQFFLDLWEYQAQIVRDHAVLRDSIGRAGGPRIPAAQYFQARALQEMGLAREAAAAYSAVRANAPDVIRALSETWSAALSESGGETWQLALVRWRAGKVPKRVNCPTDAVASCRLFSAIVAEDADAIVREQAGLLARSVPDYRETIRTATGTYSVDFYDPVEPFLLGVADYVLAAQALRGMRKVAGAEALRGVALLRSGRVKEAESALRAALDAAPVAPQTAVAYGEALFSQGKTADAERRWQDAEGPAANFAWEARTRLRAEAPAALRSGVLRQFAGEKGRSFAGVREGRAAGDMLARALLRAGRYAEALEVLDVMLPASLGRDLRNVLPATLLLSSRARYLMGSESGRLEHYPLSRGELAALTTALPSVAPTLYLLQQLTAPANIGDLRSDLLDR